MEEEKEEKVNEFSDWPSREEPWDRLNARWLFKNGIPMFGLDESCTVIKTLTEKEIKELKKRFEPREMADMLKDFFHNGKPVLARMGQQASLWILWSVTQGKYRVNHWKKMWVFTGQDPHIRNLLTSNWEKTEMFSYEWIDSESIMKEITNTCNRLYAKILQKLKRHTSKSKYYKCMLLNLRNLPEFVMFQNGRAHVHKQNRWFYVGRSVGGNKQDLKPAPSIPHPMCSVHHMLEDYHDWLPNLK